MSHARPYRLFASPPDGERDAWQFLGRFASYEAALLVRDEDVVRQLIEAGGWYVEVDHVILGPGLRGPETEHRLAAGVGIPPGPGTQPTQSDLDQTRHWLAQLHRSS